MSDLLCDVSKWKAGIGSSLQCGMIMRITLGVYMHLLLYSFPIRQGTGPSPYIATLNHVKLENVLKRKLPPILWPRAKHQLLILFGRTTPSATTHYTWLCCFAGLSIVVDLQVVHFETYSTKSLWWNTTFAVQLARC